MGPDVQGVRGLAARIGEQAARTRAAAGRMRAAEGVPYESPSAERYRRELRMTTTEVERSARELEEAAAALLRHAAEVERRLADIARFERWFRDRVDDARRQVADVAAGASKAIDGAADELLRAARNAPAPGSAEWLEFGRQWRR